MNSRLLYIYATSSCVSSSDIGWNRGELELKTVKVTFIIISTAPEDYSILLPPTTFTLTSTNQQKNFEVQAIDDNIFENTMESFRISISLETPDVLAILGEPQEVTVTIVDNEG